MADRLNRVRGAAVPALLVTAATAALLLAVAVAELAALRAARLRAQAVAAAAAAAVARPAGCGGGDGAAPPPSALRAAAERWAAANGAVPGRTEVTVGGDGSLRVTVQVPVQLLLLARWQPSGGAAGIRGVAPLPGCRRAERVRGG